MPGESAEPITLRDLGAEETMMNRGLGANDAMIFPTGLNGVRMFKDRDLLRGLLLTGRATETIAQAVDLLYYKDTASGNKRRKVRPSQADVRKVLEAAFQTFPRIGYFKDDKKKEIVFRNWPSSKEGQILFHNEVMQCCRNATAGSVVGPTFSETASSSPKFTSDMSDCGFDALGLQLVAFTSLVSFCVGLHF